MSDLIEQRTDIKRCSYWRSGIQCRFSPCHQGAHEFIDENAELRAALSHEKQEHEKTRREVERLRAEARDGYQRRLDAADAAIIQAVDAVLQGGKAMDAPLDLSAEWARVIRAIRINIRELERWRHGNTIEGDFVCPDSLALTEAEADLARMQKVVTAAIEWSESFGELSKRLPPHVHKLRAAIDEYQADSLAQTDRSE